MKTLRKIVGKTEIDRIRNQKMRESCDIQPIIEWVERRRRREWDENVTRMDAERSQGTIHQPEEDHQDIRKEDGATYSLIKTGGIKERRRRQYFARGKFI